MSEYIFYNITIRVRADSVKEAYEIIASKMHNDNHIPEWSSDTYVGSDGEEKCTAEIFVSNK